MGIEQYLAGETELYIRSRNLVSEKWKTNEIRNTSRLLPLSKRDPLYVVYKRECKESEDQWS